MTIEEYLNKPYWVIDILPKQVPADSRGQYFRIEKYFLEHPQIDDIYRKFTNILLKLNCYNDINVSHDGDEWITNPAPHELEAALLGSMADKQRAYHLSIIVKHTSGTEDVLLHFLHAFKVTGANLHPLIQLTFAVVGLNHKLFHLLILLVFVLISKFLGWPSIVLIHSH